MPIQIPLPAKLKEMYQQGGNALVGFLQNALDPRGNALAPAFEGMEGQRPKGLPEQAARMIYPEDINDAFIGGILGLMPGYIAANYRSPEAIQALRRVMAAENKARGPVKHSIRGEEFTAGAQIKNNADQTISKMYDMPPGDALQMAWQTSEAWPFNATHLKDPYPDPLDQILRGSWFHGMRPEARQTLDAPGVPLPKELWGQGIAGEVPPALPIANAYGLPASTHATPSYIRFGEPYGVSITASPSIARNFSADEYIHRVQPLYGGPPTEAIIPMWRPEGQKVMNEGYNQAFNEWLAQNPRESGITARQFGLAKHLEAEGKSTIGNLDSAIFNFLDHAQIGEGTKGIADFNTLYSKALQDKGYRGILYSPQRYGEYEMLMLDPSFVRPLDYRKAGEFVPQRNARSFSGGNLAELGITPSARQGYVGAQPEMQTGATRLSDVFNQVPWVDRINPENKKRIADLIDSQFREAVMNQLFGR